MAGILANEKGNVYIDKEVVDSLVKLAKESPV